MSDQVFSKCPLSRVSTAIKDGTHGTHRRVLEGVPLLSAKNISDGGMICWDENDDLISEREFQELCRSFQLEPGDLLLTIVGSIGRRAVHVGERVVFQRSVAYVRPNKRMLESRFLFHWMGHPDFTAELLRRSNATAQAGLYLGELAKVLVPELSIPQQREIAHVLDTVETVTHQTDAIIAKHRAVKQGLLHDLLTRGINSNGELRPPQIEAPTLYKESSLGWIPKAWEIKELSELLADVDPAMRSGPFGSALLKQELVEAGIPLLGIDNVHTERFATDYQRFVTPRKFLELSRYAVRPDDLLITIMGTVGRCCLVPESVGQALSSKHTWAITLDQQQYSPYLAMLQINYSPWVLQHFAKDQQGGTMMAIRSDTLRSTLFPTPPRGEQHLMEERLRKISLRIDLEVDTARKMQALKTGLMDDLLTGRVRVAPLLNQAAEQKIKRSA